MTHPVSAIPCTITNGNITGDISSPPNSFPCRKNSWNPRAVTNSVSAATTEQVQRLGLAPPALGNGRLFANSARTFNVPPTNWLASHCSCLWLSVYQLHHETEVTISDGGLPATFTGAGDCAATEFLYVQPSVE